MSSVTEFIRGTASKRTGELREGARGEWVTWMEERGHVETDENRAGLVHAFVVEMAQPTEQTTESQAANRARKTLSQLSLGLAAEGLARPDMVGHGPALARALTMRTIESKPRNLRRASGTYDPSIIVDAVMREWGRVKGDRKSSFFRRLTVYTDKTFILFRVATMARGGDALGILRDSLRVPATPPMVGGRVLEYMFKGKNFRKRGLEHGEVEFLPDTETGPDPRCPARALLKLAKAVDKLGLAEGSMVGNSLFVSAQVPYKPLASGTAGRRVLKYMKLAGLTGFTAHSIRALVAEKLRASGVPDIEIRRRGRWYGENSYMRHYTSTAVPMNIAELALSELQRPGGRTGQRDGE